MAVAALLFFGGWGVWFVDEALGFALMGAGALAGYLMFVGGLRAAGGVGAYRAWRAESSQMRHSTASSAGGWFGGDGGGGACGGGDGGGGGGGC